MFKGCYTALITPLVGAGGPPEARVSSVVNTARGVSYDTTYDFSDPTQFDKNAFKVGDTFAPSELKASCFPFLN